jgi:molecular chaperone DnaK (HSP70)
MPALTVAYRKYFQKASENQSSNKIPVRYNNREQCSSFVKCTETVMLYDISGLKADISQVKVSFIYSA